MIDQVRPLALAAALAVVTACAPPSHQAIDASITVLCDNVTPWATSAAYAVGALVTFQGATYQCVRAHTSQPDRTPPATPALWSPVNCRGGDSGGLTFSPYKDTSIHMNGNTNVISTTVSGTATDLASDLVASGGKAITLAFATGECGSESWGGVPGATIASANVSRLVGAGITYVLSTGGAAGTFTCGSDAGFATFLDRWTSANLIGVDFDLEAGQSQSVIDDLIGRIQAAHAAHPGLRFSLTLATLATSSGASTAQSLGSGGTDSFNMLGDQTLAAVRSTLGFAGTAATWPSYLTVNLMAMDYGAASPGVCVVSGGICEMGQSALQAAFNLRDRFGVPFSNIELTAMIGGNDVTSEQFTLPDVDTVTSFAIANGLAGVHYWSYDRDTDCPPGAASSTCNSLGGVGAHGFLRRFLGDGLH